MILDSDVLIDCLRGVPEARAWLANTTTETLIVPGIVAMELVVGCRNKAELERIQSFLHAFNVAWPESQDFAHAYSLLAEHRLATGLSIPDCLVAAMALNRSERLFTFNTKHYRVIAGLDVQAPYQRATP